MNQYFMISQTPPSGKPTKRTVSKLLWITLKLSPFMAPIKTRNMTVLKMAPKKILSMNHLIKVLRRFNFGLLACGLARSRPRGAPFPMSRPFSRSCLYFPRDRDGLG